MPTTDNLIKNYFLKLQSGSSLPQRPTLTPSRSIIDALFLVTEKVPSSVCNVAGDPCQPEGYFSLHITDCTKYLRCEFGLYREMPMAPGTVPQVTNGILTQVFSFQQTLPCSCLVWRWLALRVSLRIWARQSHWTYLIVCFRYLKKWLYKNKI